MQIWLRVNTQFCDQRLENKVDIVNNFSVESHYTFVIDRDGQELVRD